MQSVGRIHDSEQSLTVTAVKLGAVKGEQQPQRTGLI